ncbi:uncharacterized protein LOC113513485 isoform X2 [Galleria mellonella]|uniref:Uncharacterized protein LOC113513485 isoform X2 n=1 Tax=Galleria mellonella TaxID=7137 RepID=A0ABM3MKA2_GALME|nr:uncharacterized protein LOC113513485 isoform X2 [Galleria mellonella]XP_052751679.1 uncharacterized protein LOC113513485 isoform X2 [Galleria mellonella]XP_052751680.1 uncharacterized protein LOC113513485 isoform X2 [Galleria mellonella]
MELAKVERWIPALPEKKNLHFSIVGIQVSRIRKKTTASPTCKLLVQRSQKEDGVNGVTENSFTKYLFPMYPELARQFYKYVHRMGKCKNKHIPLATFRQQCEKILAMLDDAVIIETYVRMFGAETDDNMVTPDGLRKLLYISYKLSMDHYPEGPQTCLMIHKTLSAVVNGCFNNKESHSVGFVVRWLEEHCHRLIFPVHRYCVHLLATRHRDMEARVESSGSGAGLELATPVLERAAWAGGGGELLPLSAAWLLAGTAPALYSRPLQPPPAALPSAAWLARLVCALPSHWVPLYRSREHGCGVNRFLHHTLAYRGPSLVLLAAGDLLAALAADAEWRESHRYWGGPDCALLQLFPTFSVLERAAKMVYLNTSIRGYPLGLRAGSDPRRPLLSVDEGFDTLTFQGVPYTLDAIEVWGCGDQASRETQLEIKKWQVREAERQRQVKLSAADWIEHPDRYLLELAGRPQYNNSAS